jgi:glycosyltransferase involved in cell wall biosynthesis
MFQHGFSGGRYCALFLAEALSALGYSIDIVCQELPGIESEFLEYETHGRVKFLISPDFKISYNKNEYDFIVLIPDQSNIPYYESCFEHAEKTHTPLILLNFESENWFNAVSPFKRDPAIWSMWKEASRRRGVILSISREGMSWAKSFYTMAHEDSLFEFWYPPINSFYADKYIDSAKKNEITTITRFTDKHKGADDFCALVCEELSGISINLISSRNLCDSDLPEQMLKKAKEYNISFNYYQKLSDDQKFKIISESKVFVFPTYFEGFGYPPLESLYVNTPVVTYDLPVLRETMGNCLHEGFYPVSVGNKEELKKQVVSIVKASDDSINSHHRVYKNTNFKERVNDLREKLNHWINHF